MEHIGIAVHKKERQICILAEGGELIRALDPHRARALRRGARRVPRTILIEASTESESVVRCLEELDHAVMVANPNFVPMYATRTRKVKTDRRDAGALADACLLGRVSRTNAAPSPWDLGGRNTASPCGPPSLAGPASAASVLLRLAQEALAKAVELDPSARRNKSSQVTSYGRPR